MASTAVDAAFISQFDAEVHEAYQRHGSFLSQAVRKRNITNAQDLTFQVVGKSIAQVKARHGLVPTSDVTHTNVKVTPSDYYDGGYVDYIDLLKTNIDERQVVANAKAYAIGRKTDDLIITAAGAASNSTTATTTNSATFRNSILSAIAALKGRDVPDDGRLWGAASPTTWAWLMTVKEFTSADWIGYDYLPYRDSSGGPMMGKMWNKIKWFEHTGLAISSNNRTDLIWHQDAIGLGVLLDPTANVNYIAERDSYLVAAKMSAGAVIIDNAGVQKFVLDESQALPTT